MQHYGEGYRFAAIGSKELTDAFSGETQQNGKNVAFADIHKKAPE
jgi:hypothetical protein